MTETPRRVTDMDRLRRVPEPTALPLFRSVTRIWHFPDGTAFFERADRRDCLLSDVTRVDVPVTDVTAVGDAVVLTGDTTVRVTATSNGNVVEEVQKEIRLSEDGK